LPVRVPKEFLRLEDLFIFEVSVPRDAATWLSHLAPSEEAFEEKPGVRLRFMGRCRWRYTPGQMPEESRLGHRNCKRRQDLLSLQLAISVMQRVRLFTMWLASVLPSLQGLSQLSFHRSFPPALPGPWRAEARGGLATTAGGIRSGEDRLRRHLSGMLGIN